MKPLTLRADEARVLMETGEVVVRRLVAMPADTMTGRAFYAAEVLAPTVPAVGWTAIGGGAHRALASGDAGGVPAGQSGRPDAGGCGAEAGGGREGDRVAPQSAPDGNADGNACVPMTTPPDPGTRGTP